MNEVNEQGFLSDNFDDWSGEPIPNGWGEIEKKLRKDTKRRLLLWWLFPAVLMIGGLFFVYTEKFNSLSSEKEEVTSMIKPVPSNKGTTNYRENKLSGNETHLHYTNANDSENKTAGLHSTHENPVTTPSSDKVSTFSKTKSEGVAGQEQRGKANHSAELSAVIASSQEVHSSNESLNSDGNSNSINENGSSVFFSKSSSKEKSSSTPGDGKRSEIALTSSAKNERNTQVNIASDHNAVPITGANMKESGSGEYYHDGNSIDPKAGAVQRNKHATDVPYLGLKGAFLPTVPFAEIVPVLSIREITQVPVLELEKSTTSGKFHIYAGLQTGIGQNTIELRPSMVEHQIKITNANSIQSYFVQLSGGMNFQIVSWLKAFTGLQIGIINQQIRYNTKTKSPERFSMVAHDSLNFAMTPHWTEKSETRRQQAIYANAEFGLKPLVFPASNSGPFASVVLWTQISEKHSTDVPGSSPFIPVSSSISMGYRLGYQHEIRKNILVEAYMSSFPSGIFAGTKGVSVSPRLVGFGCLYSF